MWEIRTSPGRIRGKDGPIWYCTGCDYEVWRGYFIARREGTGWLCLTCVMAEVRKEAYDEQIKALTSEDTA